MWIRAEGAFELIVDRSLFEAALAIIRERTHKASNDEIISALQPLSQDRGYRSPAHFGAARGEKNFELFAGRLENWGSRPP